MFMVIKGTLIMEFRDKIKTVSEGEILVVPRGVEHLPKTDGGEAHILLFEPKSTLHTGNVNHEFTNNDQQWI